MMREGVVPGCAFCAIARREEHAHVVFENPEVVAFLDRRPLFYGHTLVIPRAHHSTLGELPNELVEPLFSVARSVAQVMERSLGADGSFVALNNRVSQSVPHLHVHVVPRRRKDGLRGFFWPRRKYVSEEHMNDVATTLRDALHERR